MTKSVVVLQAQTVNYVAQTNVPPASIPVQTAAPPPVELPETRQVPETQQIPEISGYGEQPLEATQPPPPPPPVTVQLQLLTFLLHACITLTYSILTRFIMLESICCTRVNNKFSSSLLVSRRAVVLSSNISTIVTRIGKVSAVAVKMTLGLSHGLWLYVEIKQSFIEHVMKQIAYTCTPQKRLPRNHRQIVSAGKSF